MLLYVCIHSLATLLCDKSLHRGNTPEHLESLSCQGSRRMPGSAAQSAIYPGTCGAQADKHTLVQNLGIPMRDLRVLDPMVQQPSKRSAIFVRERALVVNLERLRLIISKDQCIVLSAPHSPIVPGRPGMNASPEAPFIKDLVMRIKAMGSQ